MTAEVWTEVRTLVEQATLLPTAERMAFVAAHAPSDQVRSEAAQLLGCEEQADRLFAGGSEAWRFEGLVTPPDHTGHTFGNYRLVSLIGRGGMGAVYRAERMDATFEKCVAVKLIDASFCSSYALARFRAERQILADLEHPNIARLLDGGAREDGMPYLVMEYVEGQSPGAYCRDRGLTTAETLVLFRQICAGVHFAHQHMVIHRDLKPANILVTADGTPKLLDFGIAKVLSPGVSRSGEALTEPALLKMTVRYASPEQVRGDPVSTASDVYSLGVILYELLAGHSPYGDVDRPTHQLMSAVCEADPPKPSASAQKLKGDLDNIVLRALRKQPRERYASADQFSEDIRRYLEGRPVLARGDAPLYVAARFVHRNRGMAVAALIVFCSLVAGLIEVTLARARAERRFNQVRQLAHSVMFDYADAIDRLPGATPVRAQLLKDALNYLDNLSKEADTPQLRREVVDAYVRVSDVQGNEYENNLGDTAAAMATAQKAVNAAEKLLRQDSGVPALNSAANAFSTFGSLLYSTGKLAAADTAYQRVISLRQAIAGRAPADAENKIALSTCFRHMGDLYGGGGFANLGKSGEALAFYAQAKALDEQTATELPGDVDVSKEGYKTLLSISAAEAALGRHEDATRDLGKGIAEIRKVSIAEPGDTNVALELAVGQSRLGQMLLDGGNAAGALQQLSQSGELLQKLLLADPKNAVFRRGESVVETQMAAALRGTHQVREAVAHNQKALQLAQGLSRDAPNSVQYRADVANNERRLAEGLLAAGDAAGALRQAHEAQQVLCPSTAAPDANTAANCGRAIVISGRAFLVLGDARAATSAFREAEKIAAARVQADPRNTVYQSDWARAQAGLGEALARSGDQQGSRAMYEGALRNWASLAQSKSISSEDAYRSGVAAQALAALQPAR